MNMDNKVFNINGKSRDHLVAAMKLAFSQNGDNTKAVAWSFRPKHGLVFHWVSNSRNIQLPSPITAESAAHMAFAWLDTNEAKSVPLDGFFEDDEDMDGSTEPGWRLYKENWGHVDSDYTAIVAIHPAFLWYGK